VPGRSGRRHSSAALPRQAPRDTNRQRWLARRHCPPYSPGSTAPRDGNLCLACIPFRYSRCNSTRRLRARLPACHSCRSGARAEAAGVQSLDCDVKRSHERVLEQPRRVLRQRKVRRGVADVVVWPLTESFQPAFFAECPLSAQHELRLRLDRRAAENRNNAIHLRRLLSRQRGLERQRRGAAAGT